SAVSTESTGRTDVWPLSASPISRRKSSRVEMAMISAAARADGALPASLPPSRDRFDAGLGTGQLPNSYRAFGWVCGVRAYASERTARYTAVRIERRRTISLRQFTI